MFRNLRVFYLLKEMPSVRMIAETTKHIGKPIFGKFLFIYLVFYIYAQVGMAMFGGHLTYTSFREKGHVPEYYYLMNFNDFSSAMVTLF